MSGLVYEESRGILKLNLEDFLREAVCLTEYARRKTVGESDMLRAARSVGMVCYGLDTAALALSR